MDERNQIRIDKFLWSVRIYKTRSIASEECRKGRVLINDIQAKPSRVISVNEIITVKKPPVNFIYRVTGLTGNRVAAKLTGNFIEDITPEEEKMKIDISKAAPSVFRKRGTGRPTKKDRRLIDRLSEDFSDT